MKGPLVIAHYHRAWSRIIVAILPVVAAFAANTGPIDIGERRELFVDGLLVDRLGGKAAVRLHSPVPREIAIMHDAPWEGNHNLNYSVFRDGDRYRMYYSTTLMSVVRTGDGVKVNRTPTFCCYAESEDGIRWRKPELGLVEYNGSKANNIVFAREEFAGMRSEPAAISVMMDSNPAAAPDARYKAFVLGLAPGDAQRGLLAYRSPDGIRWEKLSNTPILTDGAFDAQNVVFWDAHLGAYRGYWRAYADIESGAPTNLFRGLRGIRTATSADLTRWSDAIDLEYGDSPPQHLYTNQIQSYHRAPHILIGFPTRYVEPMQNGSLREAVAAAKAADLQRWTPSLQALPDREHRELRAAASERYGSALTEALFMASRDGRTFKRWDEAFIRPGIERTGTWTSGQNYVSWPLVETPGTLEGAPNELTFYVSESYWTGTSSAARRFTLRLDGFVSVSAPMSGGSVTTKAVRFQGRRLALNFSTSAAGGILVELQDANGRAVPGFSREDCVPLFGDTIEREVTWRNGKDVGGLAGKSVRICFILRDADLFAFQFKK